MEKKIECRYCKHEVRSNQPRAILFKSLKPGGKKGEEQAHLKCYIDQLLGYVHRLNVEAVSLIQERGWIL